MGKKQVRRVDTEASAEAVVVNSVDNEMSPPVGADECSATGGNCLAVPTEETSGYIQIDEPDENQSSTPIGTHSATDDLSDLVDPESREFVEGEEDEMNYDHGDKEKSDATVESNVVNPFEEDNHNPAFTPEEEDIEGLKDVGKEDEEVVECASDLGSLYKSLTGNEMPDDVNAAKVVKDAWAIRRPGKFYPGYDTALEWLIKGL